MTNRGSPLQFRIGTVLLWMVILAMALGWRADHNHQRAEHEYQNVELVELRDQVRFLKTREKALLAKLRDYLIQHRMNE